MEKEEHEATHQPPVFHDSSTAINTPTSITSDTTFNLDATVSFPPVPRTTAVQWQEDKETQQTHAEEAFDLVSNFTQSNSTSRPKKGGGVLSNLIRLGIADRRLKATQQQQQPSKKKKRPPMYKSKSSLASQSWNVFGGASQAIWSSSTPLQTRSARTSLDLSEDPYTLAEQGAANYVHQLQERMQITADIADILQRQEFIIRLGKGLIRAGAPSHRIVSETFSIICHFVYFLQYGRLTSKLSFFFFFSFLLLRSSMYRKLLWTIHPDAWMSMVATWFCQV